jgi:uncharacterized spore protein YtfJ
MEVEELFRRAGKYLTVRRAYGPSYDHDGVLMVPVAVVAGGAGGGTGGFPAVGDAAGTGASGPTEESAGGGFGGFVYPVGVYVVRDGKVRFRPTVDIPFVAVWSLLLLRFAFRVVRYLRDG